MFHSVLTVPFHVNYTVYRAHSGETRMQSESLLIGRKANFEIIFLLNRKRKRDVDQHSLGCAIRVARSFSLANEARSPLTPQTRFLAFSQKDVRMFIQFPFGACSFREPRHFIFDITFFPFRAPRYGWLRESRHSPHSFQFHRRT